MKAVRVIRRYDTIEPEDKPVRSQREVASVFGLTHAGVSLVEIGALAKLRFLIEWYAANGWPTPDTEDEQRERAERALNVALDRCADREAA